MYLFILFSKIITEENFRLTSDDKLKIHVTAKQYPYSLSLTTSQ